MENLYVILILVIILLAVFIENKKENKENLDATTPALSNEAIQNIASVYNTQNMTVTNLKASGDINFTQFKGIIVAWSGAIADIPKSWGLCDGTKYKALDGTDLQSPDLRSKFIVGASKPGTTLDTSAGTNRPNYPGLWLAPRQVGDQGGEEVHKLTTAELPSHKHASSKSCMGSDPAGDWSTYTDMRSTHGWNCYDRSSKPIFTNLGNDPNTGDALGNGPHNNMPPFFALAYIIKL